MISLSRVGLAVLAFPLILQAAAAAEPAAEPAEEHPLTIGTGLLESSGTYGTPTTTRITSVPTTVSYDTEDWTFKVTVPYLLVTGGTGVIPGIGKTTNTNPNGRGKKGAGNSAQGLGDVTGDVSWDAYYDEESRFGIDLTGRVKFGTAARDKGLGTGSNDYTGEIGFYKSLGRTHLFADAGYTALGSSQYIHLRSGVGTGTLGMSFQATERFSAGLTLDATGAVSATAGATRSATALATWSTESRWRTQLSVFKGSGTGGPGQGAGLMIRHSF